jgi:pantetheine-phosphate adenylyltransferase
VDNGEVYIGLTSNEMAQQRIHHVDDYGIREANIVDFLESLRIPDNLYCIRELTDPYGPTLIDDFDYIVVSPETYPVALKINELRQQANHSPIEIIRVEYVLAEDDVPISSTRIALGEIDVHGRLVDFVEKIK